MLFNILLSLTAVVMIIASIITLITSGFEFASIMFALGLLLIAHIHRK